MLDSVKEEYREKIEIAYIKLKALLDMDESYDTGNRTHINQKDIDLSKRGYNEIAIKIYNGEAHIGSIEKRKVYVQRVGSTHYWDRDKVEMKFRKVFYRIMDDRLEYSYSSVVNRGHDNNSRDGMLQISEIPNKESVMNNNRTFTFYPYITDIVIDAFDELIEICFKAKNRTKLKDFSYDFERNIKDVVESHLTKVVRDRKINSVLV
jgi:hypothetical protein